MEKHWEGAIKGDFKNLHSLLHHMEKELNKVEGKQAYTFLQPIKNMVYEAMVDIQHYKQEREQHGEKILRDSGFLD